MLAKVIAWAPTRAEAAARLAAALAGARVHGLTTNRDLLVRTLRHPEFLAGRTDTAFFDRIGLDVARRAAGRPGRGRARRARRRAGRRPPPGAATPGCWGSCRAGGGTSRPSRSGRRSRSAGETVEVGYRHTRDGLLVEGRDDVVLVSAAPDEVVLEVAGVEHRLGRRRSTATAVDVDGDGWAVSLPALPRFPDAAAARRGGLAGRADARHGDRRARGGRRRR